MIAVSIIILCLYFLLLSWLVVGGYVLKRFRGKKTERYTLITVVIPFRNESENLKALCDSLNRIDYPPQHFEILFIDDESTDDSAKVIQTAMTQSKVSWRILENERRSASPKKDAITLAVEQTTTSWVVTTDADCLLPKNWLNSYSSFIQQYDPYMVCGPVQLSSSWGGFQSLENLSLQGVTIGSFGWKKPLLCNGANLGFRADIFKEVDGYAGNDHIASGDDVFLLGKMGKKYPKKIKYLKDDRAVVTTKAVRGFSQVIRQRVRWAKKTSRIRHPLLKIIGALVFLVNLWMVLLFLRTLFQIDFLLPVAIFFGIKITLDNIYIQEVNRFFRSKLFSLFIVTNGLLYPFVTVAVVVLSMFSGYRWKGRYHPR